MSKLVLRPCPKTSSGAYKNYETSRVPAEGQPVFAFVSKEADFKTFSNADINALADKNDLANINIVRNELGYSDVDFANQMTVAQMQVAEKNLVVNGNNARQETFTELRVKELEVMYNKLAVMFLQYLHGIYWSAYNVSNRYVKATIKFNDVYNLLILGVDTIKTILEKSINDKYGHKYSDIEITNSLKQIKLNMDMMIGKKN